MRKIIGIGETVLDIIFKDGQPIGAYPGGSTFNAMVSLGRSGMNTTFISEVGSDRVGDFIRKFLIENGVNADGVAAFPGSKSPISLAFLNEQNDAEYIFYKDHPHDQLEFSFPDIQPDDIVLFGSYYAVNPVIRQHVQRLLELARSRGAIIYYDVNFRSTHIGEVIKITPNLLENLDYADIVRGSKEDFMNLYKKDDAEKVYHADISFYCKRFIYTDGANQHGGSRRQFQCRFHLRAHQIRNYQKRLGERTHRTAMGQARGLRASVLLQLLQRHLQLRQQGVRSLHSTTITKPIIKKYDRNNQ